MVALGGSVGRERSIGRRRVEFVQNSEFRMLAGKGVMVRRKQTCKQDAQEASV